VVVASAIEHNTKFGKKEKCPFQDQTSASFTLTCEG
jgi:hypothetical protein